MFSVKKDDVWNYILLRKKNKLVGFIWKKNIRDRLISIQNLNRKTVEKEPERQVSCMVRIGD